MVVVPVDQQQRRNRHLRAAEMTEAAEGDVVVMVLTVLLAVVMIRRR